VLYGQLDDVKIWRLNPQRAAEEFLHRPMDAETADCWARFGIQLAEALRRYPDCARELHEALKSTIDNLIREAMNKGPETRERLYKTAEAYHALWRAGQPDSPDMTKLLMELVTWLKLKGMPVQDNVGVQALQNSKCLRLLLSELPSLECDPQFSRMLRVLAQRLGQQDSGRGTQA